jgi:hypothetical protein
VQILGTGNVSGTPNSVALSSPAGVLAYEPAQVRTAYGISQLAPGTDGTGQTIAIVGAWHSPNLLQSVDAFDRQFGISSSSPSLFDQYGPASSFVKVVNQTGGSTRPAVEPTGSSFENWSRELISNVQWAHAIAPGAKIVVVEASSDSLTDLMTAAQMAALQPGVSVVSMSWGFQEGFSVFASDQQKYNSIFRTPGVTFVASSGNSSRSLPQYPATSPSVIAVGGTSLTLNPDGSHAGESLWINASGNIGSGFGTSLFEQAPAYQRGSTTGRRQVPDVSMVADPSTGLWVADTASGPLGNPLQVLGGTSLSAPIWAGIMAMINQARLANGLNVLNTTSPTETHEALYKAPTSMFNRVIDITNQVSSATSFDPAGLGTPIANQLVESLAKLPLGIVKAIDTAISTTPGIRMTEATGSVHASPIASVHGSQSKKQPNSISLGVIRQISPKPKPSIIQAVTQEVEPTKSKPAKRANISRTFKLGSKLANLLQKTIKTMQSSKHAAKPATAVENTETVDHALGQIIDQQPGSQNLVDHLFYPGSEEFWENQVGYRKYLRKKN